MKHKNNDISNWGILLSCVFLLSFVAKDRLPISVTKDDPNLLLLLFLTFLRFLTFF